MAISMSVFRYLMLLGLIVKIAKQFLCVEKTLHNVGQFHYKELHLIVQYLKFIAGRLIVAVISPLIRYFQDTYK